MTERERVLAVLNHQVPDQLPWFADLDYYVNYLKRSGQYPAAYENHFADDGLQKLHRQWGTGFYLQGYEPFSIVPRGWESQTTVSGDEVVTTVTTPVGTLYERQVYCPASYSYAYTKHMVEDTDDLKIFLWTRQHCDYVPNYQLAQQRCQTVGDNGVVLCYAPKSPLMHLVAIRSGVENVTYMIADDEKEFNALLSELEVEFDKAAQIALDSPAECIMIPENISSECVKPFYHQYMKPYHQKWTARIHEAGKYSFVHQDGAVRGLVSELSKESHFDVIEAVTPFPVGDVDIREVRNMVDPSTIIWGGIPGGMFNEVCCSDIDFEDHVRLCLDVMTSSPNFVLGVADQVVPYSSEKRIRKVRELVDRFGKYRF